MPPTHPGYKLSTPPHAALICDGPSTAHTHTHTLALTLTHFQLLRLQSSPGRGRDTVSEPERQSGRQPRGGLAPRVKGGGSGRMGRRASSPRPTPAGRPVPS